MNRLLVTFTLCAGLALLPNCGGSAAGSASGSGGAGAGGMIGPSAGGSSGTGGSTGGTTSVATGGAGGASEQGGGAGGATGVGGSAAGGAAGTGGLRTMGGANGSGGTSSGDAAAGGATGTGGSPGTGGRADGAIGTGGTTKTGGTQGTGGVTGTGGAAKTGGTIGTGGIASTGGTGESGAPGAALIHNDVFWKDTAGNPIYSQGGGVLKAGNTYYWYGVKYGGAVTYAAKPSGLNSDTSFVAVTIYSSTDLATWKFENNALTAASVTAAGADPSNWIGRVGAAYHATTKKYVLNGQYGGSPDTAQFFATSDTPGGTFTWQRTQPTITNVTNNNCGDQSIFNDDDGTAYLVCSSLSGRSNLYVAPLRPSDYLNVEPATKVFGGAGREGNAMFKYNGRYYLCSSDLHGWNASHSYYISATNILGPYGTEGVMGTTDTDFSHVTQTGLFLTIKGSAQETVIFGGDRWSDFAGNGIGFNQWMPLTFSGTSPSMQSLSVWSIDPTTGAWSVGPGNNYVLNPSFEADRVTITQPAGWTTTSGTNATGGHSGRWAWQVSGSLDQAIANLPSGTYTLSAWVKSSGTGGQLYAKGFGGTDKTLAIGSGTSWTNVSITGITVSNGTCDVGITSTGATVTVDDFVLAQN